jgi:hypothetical protein
MTKLQSKTWRQWNDDAWVNVRDPQAIIFYERSTQDSDPDFCSRPCVKLLYGSCTLLGRLFDTEQQALDFIKEFIADDVTTGEAFQYDEFGNLKVVIVSERY